MINCKYKRRTKKGKFIQTHCFLKRNICTEGECLICKDFIEGFGDLDINRSIINNGPGDKLHRKIAKLFGEEIINSCDCTSHIQEMNIWGVDGCVRNIDIITQWLYNEAIKRKWKIVKLPLSKYFIKSFILKTIRET